MSSILKVDTIQDQAGNNIINENSNTITIGASGDTINIIGTLQNNGGALPGDISSVVAGTGLSGGGTTGAVTINIEAAQPTITSTGTLAGFTSTGIDDNATSTAITIDSSERVGIGTSAPAFSLSIEKSNGPQLSFKDTSGGTDSKVWLMSGLDSDFRLQALSDNLGAGQVATAITRSGATVQTHQFYTTDSERVRITNAGLVGIGTTSPAAKLQVTTASSGIAPHVSADEIAIENSANAGISILSGNSNEGAIYFGDNGDNDIGRIRYSHSSNSMDFLVNASIRATINSAGNVGIGGVPATVNQRLFIEGNNSALIMAEIKNIGGPSALQITANNGTDARVVFGDLADNGRGRIIYSNSDESMQFAVNNLSEKMRITSAGDLLLAKTSANIATVGVEAMAIGRIGVTRSGNVTALFNRLSSDGENVRFQKDGTTRGSIGSGNGSIYFTEATYGGISFSSVGAGDLTPCTNSGAVRNNAMDLGQPTAKFKDLYLGGGAYLGGTAAANKLDDYEEGTWTPVITGATGVTNLTGSYTKIGNLVTVWVFMLNGNIGGSPTDEMTGLPFTVDVERSTTSSIASYDAFASNATSVLGLLSTGGTNITFLYNVNNSAWLTQAIQTSSNAYLSFSASYIAN